jgi:hypothetical protein
VEGITSKVTTTPALAGTLATVSGPVITISTPLALGPIGAWTATTAPSIATETVTVSDAALDQVFYLTSVTVGVTAGESVTEGDNVSLAVALGGVPGPSPSVAYAVEASDTPSTIATNLNAQINNNPTLKTAGVTATVVGPVITISAQLMLDPSITCAANVTPPTAATENMTVASGAAGGAPTTVTVGGYATPGDTVTLSIASSAFTGPSVSLSYPVVAGDTPPSIAQQLATQINNNATLNAADISVPVAPTGPAVAISAQSSITCTANVTPPTTASERMAVASTAPTIVSGAPTTVMVSGSVTPGDTATLSIASSAFAGSPVTLSYPIGDTPSWIAASLATQINANTILQGQNISATAAGPVVSISVPSTLSGYLQWTHGASNPAGVPATEALTVAVGSAGPQTTVTTVTVGGSAVTPTDLLTLSVVTVSGAPTTIPIQTVSHIVAGPDTLATIAQGLATQVNGDPTLNAAGISADVADTGASPVITISGPPSLSPSQAWSYSITMPPAAAAGQTATETVTIAGTALQCVGPMSDATESNLSAFYNVSGSQFTDAVIGLYNQAQTILSQNLYFLAPTAAKVILIDAPSSVAERYDYVLENLLAYLQTTQSQSLVKQTLSQALNLTPTLVALLLEGAPTTATENMTIASGPPTTVTVGGYATPEDTVTLSIASSALAGSPVSLSYPVVAGDTLTSIAQNLATQITNNQTLQTAGISATATGPAMSPVVITISSQSSHPSITCTANVIPLTAATPFLLPSKAILTQPTQPTQQPAMVDFLGGSWPTISRERI